MGSQQLGRLCHSSDDAFFTELACLVPFSNGLAELQELSWVGARPAGQFHQLPYDTAHPYTLSLQTHHCILSNTG